MIGEAVEAAQIRSSTAFASGLLRFLNCALSVPGHRPYASADDALIDLRDLASELGLPVCRRALVDFVEQTERTGTESLDTDDSLAAAIAGYGLDEEAGEERLGADIAVDPEPDLDAGVDAEINLEALVEPSTFDLESDPPLVMDIADSFDEPAMSWPDEPTGAEAEMPAASAIAHAAPSDGPRQQPREGAADPEASRPTATPAPAQPSALEEAPVAVSTPPAADRAAPHADSPARDAAEPVRSRRAKRVRSTRARKDRLRSAAEPAPLSTRRTAVDADLPLEPAPVREERSPDGPPRPTAATENWLVPPERAAAFHPPVPDFPGTVPAFLAPAPAPPPPVLPVAFQPPIPPPVSMPFTPPQPQLPPAPPASQGDPFWRPPATAAPAPAQPVFPAPAWPAAPPIGVGGGASPRVAAVKLKEPVRAPRAARPALASAVYATPAAAPNAPAGRWPWKVAAAAALLVTGAIVGGQLLLSTRDAAAVAAAPAATAAPAPAPASAATKPAATATTGRLQIDTQPAGARVLLDGKPAGESPLTLDTVPAGRHTITLVSASGSVKRTVRVEPGRTAKLDVPIFSGWVGIYAPFVVEVAEAGRLIGTTEEPRLMLSPGRHVLTLANRDLGYSSVQTVDVEPGELRTLTVDPRGAVNLNATPWAEVWIDGAKIGDTPIANQPMPLGTREVVFRHPQLGERRVMLTVRGNAPTAVSVDMQNR
jgi:hypothetical protein